MTYLGENPYKIFSEAQTEKTKSSLFSLPFSLLQKDFVGNYNALVKIYIIHYGSVKGIRF